MNKNILKLFSLPAIFSFLAIFFYVGVEQTFFTWIVEKFFILGAILTLLFSFPMCLSILKNGSTTKEAFEESKKKLFSFWFSFILFLSSYFGYMVLFLALFVSFLLISSIELSNLILIIVFLSISFLALAFSLKFIMAPFVSFFEEKKPLTSLWVSRDVLSFSEKGFIFFAFLIISVLNLFIVLGLSFLNLGTVFIFTAYFFVSFLSNIALFLIVFREYEKKKEEERKDTELVRKIIISPVLAVGFIIIAFLLLLDINFIFRNHDFYDVNDEDIVIEQVEVQREGNLYYSLKDSGFMGMGFDFCSESSFEDPGTKDSYYEFIKNNPQRAGEIMRNNESIHHCFDEIMKSDHYASVIDLRDTGENTVKPGHIFSLSRVNSFRSAYLFYAGEVEESVRVFIDGVRLGNLIAENVNGPTLLEFLVAIGSQSIFLSNFDFPVTDEKSLVTNLVEKVEKYDIKEDSLKRSFFIEYMKFKYMIDNIEEFAVSELGAETAFPTFMYKPNKTKKERAEYIRWYLGEGDFSEKEDTRFRHMHLFPHLNSNPLSLLRMLFLQENFLGNTINYVTSYPAGYERSATQLYVLNLENALIRSKIIVQFYERENGTLPETLEDAFSRYSLDVPEDPFNEGSLLKYSKGERIIYSNKMEEVSEGLKKDYLINF